MTARFLLRTFLALLCLQHAVSIGQVLNLPPRPAAAPTGSQFVDIIRSMPLTERENWILAQVRSGNVPNFLRTLVAINVSATINGTPHTGTYYVTPDYLAIGTDADYFLEPMTPLLAQRLCDALGCTLPTRKMVNQIWTNAVVKLDPKPIAPSPEMTTVPVFEAHDIMVKTQRNTFTNAFPLGALVSGDKKDVIISTKIYTNFANAGIPKPVVIYGWHYTNGSPIQPLYNGHEETYADYSHGARLVQNLMTVDGAPATVTNVLTQTNLAALLSDEAASEGTSAGVIRVPRYAPPNLVPAIISQPRSRTRQPGNSHSFVVLAAGDPPLSYRWQFNGATLPNATNASLLLTNVQASNAGTYVVTVTNAFGSATTRAAVLRVLTNSYPILFADDFDTNSASKWNLFWGASNGVPDYTVAWAYDYGATPYTFNGVTGVIPPAPNSPDGSTRAVRFTVNNNDTVPSTAGVNIYPKGQSFTGNLAVKFDLWLNYPGNAGGTGNSITGSTEHATCGLNHLGTMANWAAPTGTNSDGIWFALDGEGGTTRDYRAYVGNPSGAPTELVGAASGLSASDAASPFFQGLFPAARFETVGAPGKQWVEVELRQTNNVILWLLDGTVIAQRTNVSSFTSGTVMLGFMDTFSSIANPAADAFVLFDNLRVEDQRDWPLQFVSVAPINEGQMKLILSGAPNITFTLEASSNLADWFPISTFTGSNGPVSIIDPDAANFSVRFYRARYAR